MDMTLTLEGDSPEVFENVHKSVNTQTQRFI